MYVLLLFIILYVFLVVSWRWKKEKKAENIKIYRVKVRNVDGFLFYTDFRTRMCLFELWWLFAKRRWLGRHLLVMIFFIIQNTYKNVHWFRYTISDPYSLF
jgi:hypothetical protein